MSSRAIEVRAWGQTVGAVALDPKQGYYVFAYTPEWLRTGIELAPRSMPAANYRGPYTFPNLPEATYQRLPALLADALPDDFGNALINAYMTSRGRTVASVTPLDRLAYMAKRGMGALEFRPALGTRTDSKAALDMKRLVEAARSAVYGSLATEGDAKAALNRIISVGTSAGGARAKAVVAWNPVSGEMRSGQFAADPGFEHWLVKFDGVAADQTLGGGKDFGRLEYAYHLMARAAGIRMADCRLLEEGGRAHFMTRRFDRDGDEKHHVQTLCAMEHMDFKQVAIHTYAQAFMAMAALGLESDATDELFRRMTFNVMAMNCDDHTKNLAFLLRRGGAWELGPAYDLTYAFNPKGDWTYQHQMAVDGKFMDITQVDLLQDAERFGVRNPRGILREVAAAVSSFGEFARKAGVSANRRGEVEKHLRPLPAS
jgi:serine/threonine-protein kinase HipA